jgi:hypothetical protein
LQSAIADRASARSDSLMATPLQLHNGDRDNDDRDNGD